MSKPQDDAVSVGRYVDAEMAPADRAAFESRLQAEPALAEAVAETAALRAVFAVARTEVLPMPAAHTRERVLASLQRGAGLEIGAGPALRVQRFARWCVLAAAAVLLVAVLFATGALRLPDSGQLQADSGAELIRSLDAKIQAADPAHRPARR